MIIFFDKPQGYNEKDFRNGVGLIVRRSDGFVIAGERDRGQYANRKNNPEANFSNWELPQGGLELDESFTEAAWRELKEETNIGMEDCDPNPKVSSVESYYILPDDFRKTGWSKDFIGQRHKWFLINLSSESDSVWSKKIITNKEFLTLKWLSAKEFISIANPLKIEIYEKIFESLGI